MADEVKKKKNKKVNEMTVDEIDAAIAKCSEKGSPSRHLMNLNERKRELAKK